MRVLDLFSGIGGFSLGLERAGMETVAFCELPDNQAVIRKHWPDVPIYDDIKELTHERLKADGIVSDTFSKSGKVRGHDKADAGEGGIRRAHPPGSRADDRGFTGTKENGAHQETKTIDIITGGFPCQPFSHAGQRRGTEDDRHLWPEMLRVISEVRPTWVIGENVAGIVSMELSTLSSKVESKTLDRHPECDYFNYVLSREANMLLNGICEDLEQIGYEVQPLVIPACGIDAKHRRDRVWIIAHTEIKQRDGSNHNSGVSTRPQKVSESGDSCGQTDVPNTGHTEPQGRDQTQADNQGCSGEGVPQGGESTPPCEVMGNARGSRRQGQGQPINTRGSRRQGQGQPINTSNQTQDGEGQANKPVNVSEPRIWTTEPNVGRVADGVPGRVDRLRGLGNAVVPQVVEQIGRAILNITGE